MKSRSSPLLMVLLTLAVAATVYLAARAIFLPPKPPPEPPSKVLGKTAPDFTTPLLGGGEFSLSATRGKVVVLDFWASWCPPCVESMPQTVSIAKKYESQGVELYAVNFDEDAKTVGEFLQRLNIAVPVPLAKDVDLVGLYDMMYLPRIIVIDRAGVVHGDTSSFEHLHDWLPATIESALKSGQAS